MSNLDRGEKTLGLGVILTVGLLIRFVVIATTGGTSDLWLWETFAKALQQYGLGAYAHVARLNHPPLGAFLVWVLYRIGPLSVTLRASQALADVLAAIGISEIARQLNYNRRFAAG